MKARKIACVYAITNIANGKRYIGSTVDFIDRINGHLNGLRNGNHGNRHLQSAFRKYGEESFRCSIVCLVENIYELLDCEQAWIDGFVPEYNISPTAGSCLGIKRSDETKLKISKSRTGFKHTQETRLRMSLSKLGIPHAPEWNANVSVALKGRILSPEWRRKISQSRIGKPTNVDYSSPERSAKISAALKGRPKSLEHRAKLSIARRPMTEKHRAAVVASNKRRAKKLALTI